MSSLAIRRSDVGLFGLGTPAAGEIGMKIDREAYRIIGALREATASPGALALNELKALAQDRGVSARSAAAFQMARRFLLAMPTHLPPPELSFDDDGEVALDWAGPANRMFSLAIRGDGRVAYALRLSPISRRRGIEYFGGDIPQEVVDCIEKTFSRR